MSVLTMIMTMMLVQVPLHACIEARLRSLNPLMVFQITIRHSNFIFFFFKHKTLKPCDIDIERFDMFAINQYQCGPLTNIRNPINLVAICKYTSEVNMLKDSIVYHLDKFKINKLAKLGDAIVISNLKLYITDPPTHWLTDRGRC